MRLVIQQNNLQVNAAMRVSLHGKTGAEFAVPDRNAAAVDIAAILSNFAVDEACRPAVAQ